MKYTRLTKEQFEALHREFANFLAAQSVDAKEWKQLKEEKPQAAEEELDIFSDLIWEGALSKTEYVENISKNQLYLFHFAETEMRLILVKSNNPEADLTTAEGLQWFQENIQTDSVEIFTSSKAYSENKNLDKFQLIRQGGVISSGELYKGLKRFI